MNSLGPSICILSFCCRVVQLHSSERADKIFFLGSGLDSGCCFPYPGANAGRRIHGDRHQPRAQGLQEGATPFEGCRVPRVLGPGFLLKGLLGCC